MCIDERVCIYVYICVYMRIDERVCIYEYICVYMRYMCIDDRVCIDEKDACIYNTFYGQ